MRPLRLDVCFIIKVDFNSPKGLSPKSVAPCIVILEVAMGKTEKCCVEEVSINGTMLQNIYKTSGFAPEN